MKRIHTNTIVSAVGAALALALLAGCSGVPAEVTGALGAAGEALSGVGQAIGGAVDGLLDETSVAEAREQRRSDLMPALADADLKTPGTLTVGIESAESAPLALTATDGSLAGIDVDTAYALADELGMANVEVVSVQNASTALASNCDVVMGVEAGSATDVTVLGSYAQSALGVFSAADVATAPISAADLSGKTVGVQSGSVSQSTLASLGLGAVEQTFSNLNEAFEALASGSVDYVVCDAYAGAYLSCTYDAGSFAGTLDAPVAVGVGVSSTASSELQASVQAALDAIQGNGVADIAKARWIGAFPALTEALRIPGVA